MNPYELIDKLRERHLLSEEEFITLIACHEQKKIRDYACSAAREVQKKYYGNKVYIRGLIEFTNYCKNDCFYCGIRAGNASALRYRLTKEEILQCCEQGYGLGFRTFVLQGGEDPYYSDEKIVDIVQTIRAKYPDCAITLSIGEKSYESYLAYYRAGADRYLLRHETADYAHYQKLHPPALQWKVREKCLYDLKKIGYQVGSGFMVGSPYQSARSLAADMKFLHLLAPHMVGIGPFISHRDTPFAGYENGTFQLTVFMIALVRLMLPNALIPSTTALGTIFSDGREQAIVCGANVIMPNLSPVDVRAKYALYDNKLHSGKEAAEHKALLEESMKAIGYEIVVDRGDCKKI